MLEAAISTAISTFVSSLGFAVLFWLSSRSKSKTKNASRRYLMPWTVSVTGLSVIIFLALREELSIQSALGIFIVFGILIAILVDAKKLE